MAQQRTRKTAVKPPPSNLDHIEIAPEDDLFEADDTEEPTSEIVSTGDIMAAKMTLEVHIGDEKHPAKAWGTFEFKTRVMDGETEERASARLIDVVNTRVMNLIYDADERIAE